ncbi:unnamed protein product [Candidula unifasciata]|uniref:Fanconi-associated nuclease n=1 Tax=Candidula unifasciata TaxID=100452 RepID=A0A8S3YQJ1_9EUPU|nr:unnamed protein product [Candidula unifasciata]
MGATGVASESLFRVPYYLNNFETLLNSVMEDETNKKLFNKEDLHIITVYQNLSDGAKKLYIRMFTRKLHWIPQNKLKYPEIGENLNPFLQELAAAALIDCDEQLTDLEEVLKALAAADIKTLAKSYHIAPSISQKGQLVPELLKKSQQSTLATMLGSSDGGVAKSMLARAKKYLNGIYKLKHAPRGVFVRVMMLFSLVNTLVDEDKGTGGQGQLFQMLMVNMGKLVYPAYTIEKVHHIFQDREDLIRFENALQLESDLLHCIDRGNWEQAYVVFKSIEKEWTLLTANSLIAEWNQKLPSFLRCYTATSVIHRLLCSSVEILQRRKDYTAAVDLLQTLLSETLYNSSHRGYLWERLALNLDAHMKQPLESLEAVKNGLTDKFVRVGHRYALYLRAESICQRAKLKLQHRLEEFHHEVVRKTPQVSIEGRVLHQGVSTNGTRFLTEESYVDGNSEDMTVVGVEEYVLGYYKKNGFPSGIHAEGSVVSTLFALFFWDILFMDMPDAFHSPFQALPLDLHSDMFYDRRKHLIEERLAKLEKSSVQELQVQAEETWTSQYGVVCACINWDRISLDSIKELLSCIGGEVLSGLIGRYARCPRHTRSGFPDLTLWNVDTGALKICEVKGPGDRLSHKQILWIDYLLSLGVDAEVCHVKAVAAKKLKPSQQ